MTFASLDFETANYSDASICAAGVAVFVAGELKVLRHWLVRPPKGHGYFREDFTEIHGLTWFDVCDECEFPAIAPDLLGYLTAADVVISHNAHFDLRKLCGTLRHYGLACPPLEYLCTLSLSRHVWPAIPSHSLGAVCAHVGHTFQHHNAQADAEAAGHIMLAMMRHSGVTTPMDLARATGLQVGHLASAG